jgi:penicillin-binding protein 1A
MFLTQRKTIERKIKEIILALQIERTYTKREIMEMYLNQIYFGNGAYGVESAARVYFGKHTRDLNLQECALLAGLPRSPNTYNPYRTPDKAKERRDLVLSEMKKLGFISSQEADQAAQSKIELSSVESSEAAYFVEYVRKQLEDKYGSNAIYKTGLKVFTTLDLAVQRKAQDAMDTGILEAEKLIRPGMQKVAGAKPETVQCALVVIDPASGEIKAMIGGRDFRASKFNRAVQAQRQPGSAFKPFVYATAISQGFTQADVILDTPLVFKDASGHVWKPENFTNRFYGPTCLRKALTKSINIVTVKLMEKVGVRSVIDLASKLGVQSPLNPYLTLALGASEVTLLELASAYGTFPNHGVHVEPFSIKRVETMAGEILEENTPFRQEAVDENTAAIMVDMMENVVNQGTGYAVRRLGFKYPAAGKTGTTNDFTDAWFLGYTSDYVAGVWIGLDSHRSMGRNITGGLVACPIWANFMVNLYKDRTAPEFKKPATIEYTNFCSISGLLPNPECQKFVMRGAFAIGSAPTQYCDIHTASRLAESMLGGDAQEPMDAETTAADDDESADSPAPSKANPSEKSSPPAPVRNDRPLMF